ncbi:carbohydrate-binding module family 50 protein [Parathielavia hyrcaniae]|uniref:Carbohydrate-binding module family 50 protein n=1 Tax=Parathielavia hyrcaniae TaxID=113614 RepID=A0AAN6PX22_9PEZI|nr:carbohydrate-binding module family 50 protein [Parathielavia hyrcaniae]
MGCCRVSLSILALWAFIVTQHHVAAEVRLASLAMGANGLPDECVGMLNQAVNCDKSLVWANDANTFYSEATLAALCTATCTESLSSYVSRIHSACGSSRYTAGNSLSYLAAYNAELALEKYKIVCLADSAGQRCNLLLGKLAGIDPSNQLSTAQAAPDLMCHGCAMSMIKTQLEMPLVSSADLAGAFTSLMASCKTTVNISPPGTATQWVLSTSITSTSRTGAATSAAATSTAATSCQGKTYIMQAGDTCTSVSLAHRISTTRLLAANNFKADCASFPKSGTLCIPSSAICEPRRVNFDPPRDSCADLASAANATILQMVAWNPELGTDCANLDRQTQGYTVCLSPPGGSWVNPHPSSTANATTSSIE